ncbi:MAG: restriction endonuclease [Nitrospinota bacterium]|nr:restriction endonuclease [Nitrospinota bacterium]
MAVWLIRAGKSGEDESFALQNGVAVVGWREFPDASKISSKEEMRANHEEVLSHLSSNAITNHAAQFWAFTNRIQKGDIAVLPLKTRSAVALGKVTGDYEFRDGRHARSVDWIRDDIPRSDFGQDLLYSMGAFMTVCQIQRNDAEARIKVMLAGKPDPNLKAGRKVSPEPEDGSEGPILVDLEEQAFDQIRNIIQSKFKGHNLTRLVEAILHVQGYQTWRAPEGPDGGVDLLAGYGPMGFEPPRICVQVKSGGTQNDAAVRELEGVMSRMGADQGLFVSWDGFNKTALGSNKELFFKVRLWDDKKLMSTLLFNFDKMPEEIQAELPLKRIWVVVPEEE